MRRHRDTVRWLVAQGADPGLVDRKFGGDAAGWAAEGGHDERAAWLRVRAT